MIKAKEKKLPSIFTDPGWAVLNTSILSTSNCGNPALRLFGFGPVAADGYGIGYIIKEDGISMYVFFCPVMFLFVDRLIVFPHQQWCILEAPADSPIP
jgi:hypothetical protein